ncbi:hypothetical protein V495_00174 [Pseudogymnoascus sp. VKM F-4514 (FW-929)]|nr:hypothetical protein V495_00174 [Pseudogymnoascus sp. VKM F-4514 (FW-929)]KFY66830.1 hypothetical protein V497_00673 [Pseudogymnoascus sp. VKM F-4516 (FW-969)]
MYPQDGRAPGTAIVISDDDDVVKRQDTAMLLLTLRADVDKIDILQRQYYELEIAGYKSHIAKLEEAAPKYNLNEAGLKARTRD